MKPEFAVQVTVPEEFKRDPGAWLVGQAREGMNFLLAHADDGVIWGQINVKDKSLMLAGDVFGSVKVEFKAETLHQAHLFGEVGELYLWRTPEGSFAARLIADGKPTPENCIEDHQWLWGTLGEQGEENKEKGFTLLFEGRQGLIHAPPITGLGKQDRVMLTLRHYVDYDKGGQAYIFGSRLTGLRKVI